MRLAPGLLRWLRPSTAAAAVGAAAACALALSGCGIPAQTSAQPVSGQVPNRILSPVTTTTLPRTAAGTPVPVYFVKTGRLVPESRLVPPTEKTLPAALAALFAGPNTREIVTGVKSALGEDSISLLSPPVRDRGVVTVNFSSNSNFGQLAGANEVLGIAQVVYTVEGIDPNAGVQFQLGGATLVVPTETGALSAKPVHASQYASLLAPASSTSTTTSA